MADKPRSREKNVTGAGNGVHRRGSGTGMGPVGSGSYSGGGGNSGGPSRAGGGLGLLGMLLGGGGGKGKFLVIVLVLVAVLVFGGGKGLSSLLGGAGSLLSDDTTVTTQQSGGNASPSSLMSGGALSGMLGSVSNTSSGWTWKDNTGKLDKSVDPAARDKYTEILGGGKDTVTIMVYMCGTDLESKNGMASADLSEMASATLSDKVNIIVFTGGCKQWKTSGISNSVNQIYRVNKGGLEKLVNDAGTLPMTDPDNLTDFIKYCKKNYPANRNMLIFWDHGGGSVSGYGYDEKNAGKGSMNLAGINTALKNADMKYDFIGFDACLMATLETDLMASDYADYMIASEETEPGVGWYYTNWLTELSKNTSMPTVEIGKLIVDDFVETCGKRCPGQKTTLSVVDLAELSATVSDDLKKFSKSTTELIKDGDYSVVSDARSGVREFATSSRIDQIDLYSFARKINTKESKALAETLLGAVKYNRTSSNMADSYGISIYFPYRKTSNVNSAVKNYDAIGLDSEYSACIKEFASLELSGQAATGGFGSEVNPLYALLGASSGASNSSSALGLDSILSLVGAFSGGGSSASAASGIADIAGLFLGRSMTDAETASYIEAHQLDNGKLNWSKDSEGNPVLSLADEDWALVHSIDLNVFVDDGTGYVDMGLDNIFYVDDYGRLVADTDGTWISINNQPVAYYHTDTVDDGTNYTITGYVPALLNGERVKLILVFDNNTPHGYIAGADPDYDSDVTETKARGLTELKAGDKLDFLCDYYSYDGTFKDSFFLGEQMTVTDNMQISDTYLGSDYIALYKLTDIYNQSHWTSAVPK